jgi:hypothetical protein
LIDVTSTSVVKSPGVRLLGLFVLASLLVHALTLSFFSDPMGESPPPRSRDERGGPPSIVKPLVWVSATASVARLESKIERAQ